MRIDSLNAQSVAIARETGERGIRLDWRVLLRPRRRTVFPGAALPYRFCGLAASLHAALPAQRGDEPPKRSSLLEPTRKRWKANFRRRCASGAMHCRVSIDALQMSSRSSAGRRSGGRHAADRNPPASRHRPCRGRRRLALTGAVMGTWTPTWHSPPQSSAASAAGSGRLSRGRNSTRRPDGRRIVECIGGSAGSVGTLSPSNRAGRNFAANRRR